jgi:hypothetical protein
MGYNPTIFYMPPLSVIGCSEASAAARAARISELDAELAVIRALRSPMQHDAHVGAYERRPGTPYDAQFGERFYAFTPRSEGDLPPPRAARSFYGFGTYDEAFEYWDTHLGFGWEFNPIHMRALDPEAAEEIRDAAICLVAKLER